MSLSQSLITQSADLLEALKLINQTRFVALDVEFLWTTTYYPKLGLIQCALPDDQCFLIDPMAMKDLSPLGLMLSDASVVKIFHDAPQDLTILNQATQAVPCNMFDMRVAAGFCGFLSTLSLSSLLTELFGIAISKTEQRSDWTKRPLTPQQIAYAMEDVRHMPRAYLELKKRLAEQGREAWLTEEMSELEDPAFYGERDPNDLFRRVKGTSMLSWKQLAVLRELAVWRETEARHKDMPRRHIITDESLVRAARMSPVDMAGLIRSHAVSERNGRRYGQSILQAIQRGLACPREQWPVISSLPEDWREIKASANSAIDYFRKVGAQERIDPILIATNAEATAFVSDGEHALPAYHKLLRGWRKNFVGDDVLKKMMKREVVAQ